MNGQGVDGSTGSTLVDARGLRCPAPVIALARAAREAAPGTVLIVWWTDPAARHDIPAWARMRGHKVLVTEPLAPEGRDGGDDDGRAYVTAYVTRVRTASGGAAG